MDENIEGGSDVVEPAGDVEVGSGEEQTAPETPAEGQEVAEGQEGAAEAPEGETEEAVKDENGEEFIPRKAFDARIAKLTAQKHNAISEFLTAAQNDPTVKAQLQEALGITPAATADKDDGPDPDVAPLMNFLEKNVSPEHREHYTQFGDALATTLSAKFERMVEQRLNPMVQYIGKQEVSAFTRQYPDAKAIMPKLQQMVSGGRARNLEDAYTLATAESRIKGAGASALNAEKARAQKIAGSPINRRPQPSTKTTPKFTNIAEALAYQAKQMGYSGR